MYSKPNGFVHRQVTRRRIPWIYRGLLCFGVVMSIFVLHQASWVVSSDNFNPTSDAPGTNASWIPQKAHDNSAKLPVYELDEMRSNLFQVEVESTDYSSVYNGLPRSAPSTIYSPQVMVDPAPSYYKPLVNRFLLGPYANEPLKFQRVSPHTMDAVVVASGPDPTVAIGIHNLFHLCGFRRFVFITNNAPRDCPILFDMVPQHYPEMTVSGNNGTHKPHICLDHLSFFNDTEKERLTNSSYYPNLHVGAPGKLQRGKKKVQVPRMGWYLQQISKLRISQFIPDLSPQYLAIDGDLIFTRPFHFRHPENTNTWVMPTTSKSPKHWRYFVDWIFGNEWNHTHVAGDKNNATLQGEKSNFVVGWMVLDQTIIQDMIRDIDRLVEDEKGDVFPFSILNRGEAIIHQTFFSEFYVYARYALRHTKGTMYKVEKILEPDRNPGEFKYTCILTRGVYTKAQSNPKRAPFLIWEAHKHYDFDSCPDKLPTHRLTNVTNVGIWHDFYPPPWGGGNQFLLALRNGLQDAPYHWQVMARKDPYPTGPNVKAFEKKSSILETQVLLANSITFKGKLDAWDALKDRHQLALVHRVDGPYYSTRYGKAFQNQTLSNTGKESAVKLPPEDQRTKSINRKYACATVFQSAWSLEANQKIGLSLRNPVLIPNTVDPSIFYPQSQRKPFANRRIRIVATSHSDNERKGFDTMLWLDQHLDTERFEFWYMGGIPRDRNRHELFVPENIQLYHQKDSAGVANFLRSGDIYFAPSRAEPASNAVLEALACGLPVVYQKGSSHGDLVGEGGIGFDRAGQQILEAVEHVVQDYETFLAKIRLPSLTEVTQQYASILRWCFYMKFVML